MKEGDLDAIFFAAFVAQDIRDDDGNGRAKSLCLQMIDSIKTSIDRNSDKVGLALNPEDAYTLEKQGKHAIYIGIENGYPIGSDISNVELYYNKVFVISLWFILLIMILLIQLLILMEWNIMV